MLHGKENVQEFNEFYSWKSKKKEWRAQDPDGRIIRWELTSAIILTSRRFFRVPTSLDKFLLNHMLVTSYFVCHFSTLISKSSHCFKVEGYVTQK